MPREMVCARPSIGARTQRTAGPPSGKPDPLFSEGLHVLLAQHLPKAVVAHHKDRAVT